MCNCQINFSHQNSIWNSQVTIPLVVNSHLISKHILHYIGHCIHHVSMLMAWHFRHLANVLDLSCLYTHWRIEYMHYKLVHTFIVYIKCTIQYIWIFSDVSNLASSLKLCWESYVFFKYVLFWVEQGFSENCTLIFMQTKFKFYQLSYCSDRYTFLRVPVENN